jgi:outer membrane protein OmpA-like peptidoglycan-associated protein
MKTTALRKSAQKASPMIHGRSKPETGATPVHPLLRLQQSIGNQAVGRLIQAKLQISRPGDKYEQEADRMADQVMRMPGPEVVPGASGAPRESPNIQRLCTECEDEMQRQASPEENKKDEQLRIRTQARQRPPVIPNSQARMTALQSGGQPLPPSERAFFEPRFGHDLSQVRTHTDAGAAETARSINATAFTVGRNIAFGAGEYAPGTTIGRKLLAHELAHVVQQRASPTDQRHLQRQADKNSAPKDLLCDEIDPVFGGQQGTSLSRFGTNSSKLAEIHIDLIKAFHKEWVDKGSKDFISIDGYSSVDGPQDLNWRLSCDRANAAKAELVKLGVPPIKIITFAHGETNRFSLILQEENRRVVLNTIQLPTPPSNTSAVPTSIRIESKEPIEIAKPGKPPKIEATPTATQPLPVKEAKEEPARLFSISVALGGQATWTRASEDQLRPFCKHGVIKLGGKWNNDGIKVSDRFSLFSEPEATTNVAPAFCEIFPDITLAINLTKFEIIKRVLDLSLKGQFGLPPDWTKNFPAWPDIPAVGIESEIAPFGRDPNSPLGRISISVGGTTNFVRFFDGSLQLLKVDGDISLKYEF